MTNFVDVTYQQTGKSLDIDALGMREMQRRAFEERNAQYLLLKAPPASGKSRALMFLGWSQYNLGIQNEEIEKYRNQVKSRKALRKPFKKQTFKKRSF